MRNKIHTVASFRGSDVRFSARASFNFPHFSAGQLLDFRIPDTVLLQPTHVFLPVLIFYSVSVPSFVLLFFQAATNAEKVACVLLGAATILNCVYLVLISNRFLLFRILGRSMTPYVKLFLCAVESYSLCSLLAWRWRCFVSVPLLIGSQLSIFVSDAVFYRNTRYTVALLVLFVLYRATLIVCVRYNYFGNLNFAVYDYASFQFFNSGTFVSKSISLLLFQCGQLFFYLRYRHRLFSIRTSYTVLSNTKWGELERIQRIRDNFESRQARRRLKRVLQKREEENKVTEISV